MRGMREKGMREKTSANAARHSSEHPLLAISSWLWVVFALAMALRPMGSLFALALIALLYALYLIFILPLAAAARRNREKEMARLAEGLRSKPGPFAEVPERPFEQRLRQFAGRPDPDSQPAMRGPEASNSRMPFYLGVAPRYHYRPKSAAYIRALLERIRQALQGGAE